MLSGEIVEDRNRFIVFDGGDKGNCEGSRKISMKDAKMYKNVKRSLTNGHAVMFALNLLMDQKRHQLRHRCQAILRGYFG